MSDPRFDLWYKYSSNSQAVDYTLTALSKSAKDALRVEDRTEHDMISRVLTIMLAAYMESRVNEIAWHYSSVPEIEKIRLSQLSVENRWRELVRLGFANRRKLDPHAVPEALGFTDRARYDKLISIVNERIVPLAQVRNSLAHGKWLYVFDKTGMTVDTRKISEIARYSLWRVTLERNMLGHLADLVHDLVVTRNAHERDFDKRVRNLQAAEGRITNGSRKKWEQAIIRRYRRRPKR